MQEKVAVIDIGSNTIKLLVARRDLYSLAPETIHHNTLEVRIGQGMSAAKPFFPPNVITRATNAIASLVIEARAFSPTEIQIVATSAARDASNSDELAGALLKTTGLKLEILSGQREAELIGNAIQLDPEITAPDFYVFDLGGGSLECLRFAKRRLARMVSLPLGCVRLSEKLLADRTSPFTTADEKAVATEVEQVLAESGFLFSLPGKTITVGTGGTLTTALNILAARKNQSLQDLPPYLSKTDLQALLTLIGNRNLTERLKIQRLSAGRADVFPTALATFLALLELTGNDGFHHSLLNLRFGLAAEMLDRQGLQSSAGS